MDLLRQILARLPLQRLTEISPIDDLIRIRARVVNRLSDGEIAALQVGGSDLYLKHCTLQGELFRDSNRFVQYFGLLAYRAAFLRDKENYLIYSVYNTSIDLSLLTDDWDIQRRSLQNRPIRQVIRIVDPESINWTNRLLRHYHDLFSRVSPLDSELSRNLRLLYLAGYLQFPMSQLAIPATGRFRQTYWNGYFRRFVVSERSASFDPEGKLKELEQSSWIDTVEICACSGYHSPYIFSKSPPRKLIKKFLHWLQPDLMKMLPVDPDTMSSQEIFPGLAITPSLLRRAREMLSIIREHYPNQIQYRNKLEIILGMPVSSEDISLMTSVAHPQMKHEWVKIAITYPSVIYYDLDRYFGGSIAERDLDDDRMGILFATGKYSTS